MNPDLASVRPATAVSEAADERRLAVLRAVQISDTPQEDAFDRLARLAALTLDMPIALISLVDADRQWFKSRCGLDAAQASRAIAFCDHAIRGTDVLVVPDSLLDVRFADNPSVNGAPNLRFYAGCPLIAVGGERLGTICVFDTQARSFDTRQKIILEELARQTVQELAVSSRLVGDCLRVDENWQRQIRDIRLELEALLNASGGAAITFDRKGIILSWQGAAEKLLGYTATEAVGMSIDRILPQSHLARQKSAATTGTASAWLCAYYPSGAPEIAIARHRDGRKFPVDPFFAGWPTADGTKCAGVILRDATVRNHIEEELKQKRAHLLEAQRIGGIGSWDWNVGADTILPSEAMCELIGIPVGSLRSPGVALSAIHPDDRARWREAMDRAIAGENEPAVTYRMLKADGTVRYFQSIGRLMQQSDGPHLIGVVRDVTREMERETERTLREEDLRRSQMHLAEAQRVGEIGSWDWHLATDRIDPSEEMRKLIGLGAGAARTHQDARESIHPEDRAAWQDAMGRMAAGERVPPVSFRMIRPDGSIRIFQSSGQRVEAADGPHVIGVLKDITERVQRESERREREKLAALGQLAGGVAHEINNLLQPIISLPDLVSEDIAALLEPAQNAEILENLDIVMKCGRDAREIVRKILRYARQETPELAPTDIAETLRGAVGLVRELLSPGVEMSMEVDADLLGVARINGAEMTQIVTNLAVNADHAMKGQGALGIRLERRFLTPLQAAAAAVPAGSYFVMTVSDSGSGMDAATKARIFDPFFTTKPLGQGTGLGLSMVHGILQSWNGAITVDSTLGKGTVFSLFIPALDETDLPSR